MFAEMFSIINADAIFMSRTVLGKHKLLVTLSWLRIKIKKWINQSWQN